MAGRCSVNAAGYNLVLASEKKSILRAQNSVNIRPRQWSAEAKESQYSENHDDETNNVNDVVHLNSRCIWNSLYPSSKRMIKPLFAVTFVEGRPM